MPCGGTIAYNRILSHVETCLFIWKKLFGGKTKKPEIKKIKQKNKRLKHENLLNIQLTVENM